MTDNPAPLLDAFRQQVRQFLATAVPPDIQAAVRSHALVSRDQACRWQKILHQQGWAAPSWPRQYGGTGWSLREQAIFKEELAASDAPHVENLGIDTIGPTLMRFGSEAQRQHFLPRMLSFEDYWAQGYSEPDAGSDLASLKTTATQQGDGSWVVNGSKIWQSLGHWANWALVLARTDTQAARKQEGISVFLVDLTAPGVTVRPIKYIHGAPFHVQIFFDEVRVPADQFVGEVNQGWHIAKGLLVIERLFVARVAECKAGLAALGSDMAERLAKTDSPDDPQHTLLRSRLAALRIRGEALEACWAPAIAQAEAGGSPALEASLLKLDGIELLQDIHLLDMDLRGCQALRFNPGALQGLAAASTAQADGNAALGFWRYRGSSLAGGSTEVQQGIVAKAVLAQQTALHHPPSVSGSSELAMVLDSLNGWLARHHSFELRQKRMQPGHEAALPTVLADLARFGVLAMPLPERLGGLERPLSESVHVLGALGEALMNEPVLWQSALPVQLLLALPSSPAIDALLQSLGEGVTCLSVPLDEANLPVVETTDGKVWSLSGQVALTMGAADGAGALVSASESRSGELCLFHLTADQLIQCAAQGQLDCFQLHDGRPAFSMRFQQLALHGGQLIAQGEQAQQAMCQARRFAMLALCAESVAASRQALRQTVDYLCTRQQFSRPLFDFQVLQHRVADLYRQWTKTHHYLDSVLKQANDAAPDVGLADARKLKYLCGVVGRRIALDVLQLHGAIGFQDETPISHYAKRIFNNDMLLGSSEHHLAQQV
ncbi:MAG: acyl-CoA dehydrogenase family protein [Comamonas sp.]